MKAVILAAGEGTRLRPFTASEPKVMIPVANKPILQFIVESLVDNGITDIVIVVGYQRRSIMSHFGNGDVFGANIEYVNEEKQLGTAHALYQAKSKIKDRFIVLPGDNVISKHTISDLLDGSDGYSVLITTSEEPSKYGVISMDNGLVSEVIEKPEKSPSHLISTGIYALEPNIFDYIEEMMDSQVYDMTTVIDRMIEDHDLKGIITESTWIDAVHPWDLIPLNSTALASVVKYTGGTIEKGVVIKGNVWIGEGAEIKGGSYVEGPVIIGEGCEIGPHACILPSTSIGSDTRVQPFSIVKNSLVMKGVEIGPNSIVERSVIGDGVHINGNFSSNVNKAQKVVGNDIKTIERIGCMIAEDTVIGSGVTVKEGVIIGSTCTVGSGTMVRDNIPSFTKVL